MISQTDLDRLKGQVRNVETGRWLVTDRVADRVDALAELVFNAYAALSNGMTLSENLETRFADLADRNPQRARAVADQVTELQHLLGQIADHFAEPAVTEINPARPLEGVEQP